MRRISGLKSTLKNNKSLNSKLGIFSDALSSLKYDSFIVKHPV